MASLIPRTYNLEYQGPRRQGQTKKIQYGSLHGDRLRAQRAEEKEELEEDINAPPQSSSDENESTTARYKDEISDESEMEVVKTGEAQPRKTSSPRPPMEKDDSKSKEIYEFTGESQTSIKKFNGAIRGSQKRKSDHMSEEDDVLFTSMQSKKPKKGSGYGKAKTLTTNEASRKRENKAAVKKSSPNTNLVFRDPITVKEAHALVDKREKAWNSSPMTSQNSSPARSKGGQNLGCCSKGSQKAVFKSPPPKVTRPPRNVFKVPPEFPTHTDTTRTEKPNQGKPSSPRKPLKQTSNALNVGALTDIGKRLGVPALASQMAPSSVTAFSPTVRSSASSGLSSPPTSFTDADPINIESSQENDRPPLQEDFSDIFIKKSHFSQGSQSPECPMCKAPVDSLFLEGFTGTRRMTIREQTKFCKAHKVKTAEEEWKDKGYPEIDWGLLSMSAKMWHEQINELLDGTRVSYYRNVYEDFLKREKHKTLQQSLVQGGGIEDFSPGYYGSRGARIMIENLMAHFASSLRKRSAYDSLISSGGVSNYVQAVLVPELATLLVMDDLKVDAEKAREVLRDSVEIGNFLNEEEDEVIKDPEMEDVDDIA